MPEPDPGRPDAGAVTGGGDAAGRAVLVVALVCAAALALSARRGLAWSEIADPVGVRWARVLLGTVALLALGAAARAVLVRLRASRRRSAAAGPVTEPEAEPVPFLLRVLAVGLVLAGLWVAWQVIGAVSGAVPPDRAPAGTGPAGSSDPAAPAGGTSWPLLVAVAAVLAGAALAGRFAAARANRTPETAGEVPATGAGAGADPTQLVAAVDAAGDRLAGQDDARAAIVAAYAAMAASVAAGLARRREAGLAARASDTPTELLDRAVVAGLVGPGPAAELTALFGEARFSRHPMGPWHRRAAQDALARVRDELAGRP